VFTLRSCRRVSRRLGSLRAEVADPCLVLRTSRNDHDVTLAAEPLFAAEADGKSEERDVKAEQSYGTPQANTCLKIYKAIGPSKWSW
jgi:hypothetical protein